MTQTFTLTQNEIIRYIYNETTPSENLIIEECLAKDLDCLDFYLDCIQLQSEMNQIELTPKNITVENILDFSKNYKPAV